MIDNVKQPQHYKQSLFEVLDEMIIAFGPRDTYTFCILNAWKYRARAPYKGSMDEDILKSSRYLEYAKDIVKSHPHTFGDIVLVRQQAQCDEGEV